MSNHSKINDRLEQIELAGKANGYGEKTITRLQRQYRLAMQGKSRKHAINAFCAECMGWEAPLARSIRECTSPACPLYPYRQYQTDEPRAVECTLCASGASRIDVT